MQFCLKNESSTSPSKIITFQMGFYLKCINNNLRAQCVAKHMVKRQLSLRKIKQKHPAFPRSVSYIFRVGTPGRNKKMTNKLQNQHFFLLPTLSKVMQQVMGLAAILRDSQSDTIFTAKTNKYQFLEPSQQKKKAMVMRQQIKHKINEGWVLRRSWCEFYKGN